MIDVASALLVTDNDKLYDVPTKLGLSTKSIYWYLPNQCTKIPEIKKTAEQ